MKKLIVSLIIISSFIISVSAQNEGDAFRYSQAFPGATARSLSMGGAFSSLGGDFSSLSQNPGGLGVYRGSEFVFTPRFFYKNSEASYLGNTYSDYSLRFGINNIGYIYTHDNNTDEGIATVSFGFGYNRLMDYTENTTIRTPYARGSLLDEFVDYANMAGHPDRLDDNYEWLAYNTYLLNLDTIPEINGTDTSYYLEFWSHMTDFKNYGQILEKTISRSGRIGEYTFSIGTNISNMFYLGATLGIDKLYFSEKTAHFENDVDDLTYAIDNFTFKENKETFGTGYNLKTGLIFRPLPALRFGLAVHTPTFYYMESNFSTSVNANYDSGMDPANSSDRSSVSVNTYSMTTPLRAIAGVALLVEKKALFSFDYEYVDYTTTRFRSSEDSYSTLNNIIQNTFQETHNFRGGVEFRIDPVAIRGGYATYMSPYKSSHPNKGADVSYITGGIGYRQGNFSLDFAYARALSSMKHFLFNNEAANIKYASNQFVSTIGFRF
jgi:hypothetical protein